MVLRLIKSLLRLPISIPVTLKVFLYEPPNVLVILRIFKKLGFMVVILALLIQNLWG